VTNQPNSWAYRFALLAAISAVPLVLFGGSVTTLGAGMAVEGWLIAEGHFLLFFPVDSWFRDTATFVEHTHRLFGMLVGLFAIASVVASFASRESAGARGLALLGLLLVCGQGVLGGFRVLENEPRLAFLHGAAAQAVFAALCASAWVLHRGWKRGFRKEQRPGMGLRLLALGAVLLVYAQIVLGAWYRHALRPTPMAEAAGRFMWHAFFALLLGVFLVALIAACRRAKSEVLLRSANRLVLFLGLQIGLGVSAWLGYRPSAVGVLEWGLSILHVLGGGLLLAQTLFIWMWMERSRLISPALATGTVDRGLVPREAH